MNFAQAVAKSISDAGARHVFGIMGSGNMRVIHHLEHDHSVIFHAVRHEAGAAAAADGFARASDEVGVCLVTQGPGLTNTITAMVTARKANTPMVLVTGDSAEIRKSSDPFARVQAIDTAALLASCGIESVRSTPDTVISDVRHAFARAALQLQPIAVVLPYQYELVEVDDLVAVPMIAGGAPEIVEEIEIEAASARLRGAQRPLILAGRGAVRADAGEAIRALADELGALVGTSLPASGYFAGHPGDIGLVGGFARPSVQAAVNSCDCVLAVGVGLNGFTTDRQSLMQNAEVIHVDRDPAAFDRHRPAGSTISGDARVVVEKLVEQVRKLGGQPTTVRQTPAAMTAIARKRSDDFEDEADDGLLDPRKLCVRLDELLPVDRAVVTDGGRFVSTVIRRVMPDNPDALLYMQEFGSVGGGLGAAIGAAVARPERITTLFTGDAGMMMTLGDLDLPIRERVPMVVVCMNDEALGSEIRLLGEAGLEPEDAYIPTPDLALVARAMGAEGQRIDAIEQLDELPGWLDGLDRPLVLDCRITRASVGI